MRERAPQQRGLPPEVKVKTFVIVCVLALFLTGVIACEARSQSMPREPEFADEIDMVFSRASEEQNRQKFYSILVFVVLGGACTYVTFRGIKKVVSVD